MKPTETPALTIVTLWFVSAAQPRTVMEAEPEADRGFARKYLSQFNPAWPLTHIGDFDMARSSAPGVGEFYIGGYPGLSVVQTVFTNTVRISEVPARYRNLVSATDVYATALSAEDGTAELPGRTGGQGTISGHGHGYGAFAHWSGGALRRAFAATRETIFEDTGLPDSFELPFWSGNTPATGIELPFIPSQLARAAEKEWLGFSVAEAEFTIPISAFAVDGRPEAKAASTHHRAGRAGTRAATTSTMLPSKDPDIQRGYDDYSDSSTIAPQQEPSTIQLVKDAARSLGQAARQSISSVSTVAHKIGDEVRRRARHAERKS